MKLTDTKACITGRGFITSIGNGLSPVLKNLKEMQSGIRPHRFMGEKDRSYVKVAGVIDGFDFTGDSWAAWTYPKEYDIPKSLRRCLPPHGFYAYCAAIQALEEAQLTREDFSNPRIGLFCASAGSPFLMRKYLNQLYSTHGRRGTPMGVVSTISGTLNFTLAAHFGIKGANSGFVSACSSSSHAIGYAIDAIRLGRLDAAMIIGAEDFTADSLLPFSAMNALSRGEDSTASRPWDLNRDGFVATGGACALIIESEASAHLRKAKVKATIKGWGQSADGFDMTSSHPNGEGLARSMENALIDADIEINSIDYINAHATSTQIGDLSEANAIRKAFIDRGFSPLVSSTKGITGHPLSMAGAMETAFCSLFLEHRFISGNAHLETIDPQCDCLNLPKNSESLDLRTLLSNSSGFGGSNVSLILQSSE